MPRRWRGALTIENLQTGDGRVFAPGSIEWADLPLPLSWMSEGGSLHVDMATTAPQIGIIESITREGDQIIGEGVIDDSTEHGADVCRRMDDGLAPLGTRFPVSIDPDNWEVEVILTDVGEAEDAVMVMFSGEGAPPSRADLRARLVAALRAAAGDPDPGEGGGEGGETLFQDSVDEILERYTRLRIRGATLCDIAAFDPAWIELVAEAAASDDAPVEEAPDADVAAAVAALVTIPTAPPRAFFEMPEPEAGSDLLVEQNDGGWAVPLTITDDGHVFGHLARAGVGHRGYTTRHVPPPTSSVGYREFHVGQVVCDDGTRVATGALVVGCDHAPLSMSLLAARDHYANSGLGWADGRVSDGTFGPWFSGALRPGLTDEDLRVLRALTPSGDWRAAGDSLELCAVLSVNTPGFPIAREPVAASAAPPAEHPTTALRIENDEPIALVAAGLVQRCSECAERAREREVLRAGLDSYDALLDVMRSHRDLLARLERRTRHLEPVAASAIAERVHANGGR